MAADLAEAGERVVFWTAADAEDLPLPPQLVRRACFWRCAVVRPRVLRRVAIVTGWLVAGAGRCVAATRPGDVLRVKGRLFPVLLVPLIVGARLRGCTVQFSPHTTFAQSGGRADQWLVRWLARLAHVVLASPTTTGR